MSTPEMTLVQSILLGIVEGITEYLPVSSTGHLLLTQNIMGIGQTAATKDASEAYAVCIQAGAILAVAGLYFKRLRAVLEGALGKNPEGLRLGLNLMMGFIPAAIMGLTLEKWIKHHLFGGGQWGLWPIVAAWFAGGVAILLIEWCRRASGKDSATGMTITEITWKMALLIGAAQVLAMWPGVSRSLATILGGLWAGLSLVAAVEFSFLLGLITLSAATVLDALKNGGNILALYGWLNPLMGLIAAFLSAAVAIKWMVRYLQRHPLAVFGYYRILLAIAVTAYLL